MTRYRTSATLLLASAIVAMAPRQVVSLQRSMFSSGTEAVLIDVLVTAGGESIGGLRASDFLVHDNGIPQKVELVATDDVASNLFLVLDSGSDAIRDATPSLDRGIARVVQRLHSRDRMALITFGRRVQLLSPLMNKVPAAAGLLASTGTDHHSAVADALYVTSVLSRGEPGRSIALVFTQGEDSASWLSNASVLAAARRSHAVVYGITLHRPVDATVRGFTVKRDDEGRLRRTDFEQLHLAGKEPVSESSLLHQVADATGGRVVYADSAVPVEQTLLRVVDEFRSRYVLSFRPSMTTAGWHELSVKVRSKRASVSARKGYFVGK